MISRSCDKGNGNNKQQIIVRETKTGSTAVGTRVKNGTVNFTVREMSEISVKYTCGEHV